MHSLAAFIAGMGIGYVLLPFGFWFWLILAGDFLWISWLVSDTDYRYGCPNGPAATVMALITAVAMQLFTPVKPLTWAITNPGSILWIAAIYILVGVAWSFGKWWLLLTDYKTRNKDSLTEANSRIASLEGDLSNASVLRLTSEDIDRKTESLKSLKRSLLIGVPTASDNKSRITAWIAYWPWSFMWTTVTEFVFRFFSRLFQMLEATYDSIQKRILKDFYKD